MIVTKIEPVTKTKFKVYVDEQFAFMLYKGELLRFHIVAEEEISQETVDKINKEIILKRVRMRAMYLLNQMDRTEQQLRTKLKQNGYTDYMIDQALAYVKSFGYINDSGYTERFIMSRMKKKSKKEIYAALCQKGIDKETIDQALEECYAEEDEKEAIKDLIRKKRFDVENADYKEKEKIYAYLMRKGFSYESVRQVLQVSNWNA